MFGSIELEKVGEFFKREIEKTINEKITDDKDKETIRVLYFAIAQVDNTASNTIAVFFEGKEIDASSKDAQYILGVRYVPKINIGEDDEEARGKKMKALLDICNTLHEIQRSDRTLGGACSISNVSQVQPLVNYSAGIAGYINMSLTAMALDRK